MATQPSKPSPEVLAKLKQLREQFAAKAEMERRRRQAQDNWEQSDTYKRQYPQGESDGGRVPSLDEMRLAITKAKGGSVDDALKKFLAKSKVKGHMYHGTPNDFSIFGDEPLFVSPDPHFAAGYGESKAEGMDYDPNENASGLNVMPVHVSAKNPFDYENSRHVKALHNAGKKLGLDWLNPVAIKSGSFEVLEEQIVQDLIKNLGHDSFYVNEGYGSQTKNLGLFSRNQVKSAIGNRGTYDPNDPDITKAKGGSVEPKSTVKAYKLFRVHPDYPGKLFPLFVDANTPVEMNKWVDAKEGEMANGKVKSKIGALAYRPGWHAGDLPIATHIGEKSDPKLTAPDRRPANHAWAEVEMPNDVDWQAEANKRGTNAQGKVIPVKAHITDQIPKGGHYRYKTNPNMTGNWLIGGSMKVNKVLTDAEVARINKAAGISDLPRAEPFKKKAFGFAHGGVTHAHHLEIEERPL